MTSATIISLLPYSEPFLFVDSLISVDENRVEGVYTFRKDSYFYEGHFKGNPITPGVILTECMAQIGLVCLGIYLTAEKSEPNASMVAMSSSKIDFLKAVKPGECVRVIGNKEYFRFNKLKCRVKMLNQASEVVCQGTISGMIVPVT